MVLIMKNYTQVYVKNSFEAAAIYCQAFGAEITREFINKDHTAYEHCELSVDGEGFLALAEASNPCNIEIVHKYKWETMTFNVFEMGNKEKVYHAFHILSNGGVIIEPIHEMSEKDEGIRKQKSKSTVEHKNRINRSCKNWQR